MYKACSIGLTGRVPENGRLVLSISSSHHHLVGGTNKHTPWLHIIGITSWTLRKKKKKTGLGMFGKGVTDGAQPTEGEQGQKTLKRKLQSSYIIQAVGRRHTW
ncbi:hypothetical protein PgNI_10279 [Pyricularia grisea]|uniref:Uncharacterized protein n=1 Tax=Pyricularia grisea TaxID=148305 RepID=A0A6P8AZ95_PYRGI|nr:hypothetical protein PgNI_10279 [Pyricularia grisea]TLD07614.1 hypothetical protein PgNI_10279 [Pyricularia grisea]